LKLEIVASDSRIDFYTQIFSQNQFYRINTIKINFRHRITKHTLK
jgi:hypothetical protein